MNENNILDRALDWDDEIQKDSSDFLVLPEGTYEFTVTSFERSRHQGSDKLPACPKAVVYLHILAPEGETVIKHNLFLHTKTEGMLSAFFCSIGQKKHGEKLRMNWQAVVGAKGKCKVGVRTWKGDDGKERQSNEIKRFLDPEDTTSSSGGYTPGKF